MPERRAAFMSLPTRRIRLSARETFHIEILGQDPDPALSRVSVRVEDLAAAEERALRLFARARAPQRGGEPAEAVRVMDGAGREVFFRSRFDEGA
ncbi:hypothetical protein MET9862_04015 [Methylobacterium symbioticum]|uniref:Uncharacterized protein n=2 Tax=Methylobacterium symbioticum TaxID=2584084 RepID=A0A509EGW5_9HYPH|nr:hypothetical protein MET9862_04015 [Methylobacterium symbioticum]